MGTIFKALGILMSFAIGIWLIYIVEDNFPYAQYKMFNDILEIGVVILCIILITIIVVLADLFEEWRNRSNDEEK